MGHGPTGWHSAAASALGSAFKKPTIACAKRSAAMPTRWAVLPYAHHHCPFDMRSPSPYFSDHSFYRLDNHCRLLLWHTMPTVLRNDLSAVRRQVQQIFLKVTPDLIQCCIDGLG